MSEPSGPDVRRLRARDGVFLELERTAPSRPKADVVLVHGYGEHRGRYGHVVDALVGAGACAWTFDLRGHGRSNGDRGYVETFDDYLDDLGLVIEQVSAEAPASRGRVLFGHSLGGLIALLYAAVRPSPLAAVAVTSPFVAPAVRLPPGARSLIRLLARWAPKRDLWLGIEPAAISRDPEVLAAHAADPHVFTAVNVRWAGEAILAQRRLREVAPSLRLPVLFQLAGDDRIASTDAARALFERLGGDKTLRTYRGLFHEVLNEPERERVLADLIGWLGPRLATSPT